MAQQLTCYFRRNIRRNCIEKLAHLSAQTQSGHTTDPDLLRLYKRCPAGVAAQNTTSNGDGVSVAHVHMVRSLGSIDPTAYI
jgi:phosphatidylinositol 4-kinase